MCGAPVTRRCHVELTWIGPGVGDELVNRLGRNRWIYHHDQRHADDAGDRRDVAAEIELVVECCVDRVRSADMEERVAVRRRLCDRLGGDIARRTRPVLDDEWLTKPARQPLPHKA